MDSNAKATETCAQLQPKTSNSSGAHGIAGLSQHRHDAATRRNSIHDQHAKQGFIGQTFHKGILPIDASVAMSDWAEQSAFLRWTDPKTTAVVRNTLLEARPTGEFTSGIGLFAVREIPRGTRMIEEAPMIVLPNTQSIDDELDAFCSAFQQLTEAERSNFDQLYCGYSVDKTSELLNAVRRWRSYNLTHDTDGSWLDDTRHTEVLHIIYDRFCRFRTNFVYLGAVNASGKGLFALFSRINHSCVPNAYWTFNAAIERLTVHATRHIRVGEQITISYIKDPIAPKIVRALRLRPGNFSCNCTACTDPAMEARIRRIQELKRRLASYDAKYKAREKVYKAREKALAKSSVSILPKKDALPSAMELVALLEKQGIAGMELASAQRIGALQAAKNYAALEDLTKRSAVGLDRLQGDGDDKTDAESSGREVQSVEETAEA
ncbi:hypothetical protein NHJ13734_007147 [Beauveria thailandica]